jgi:hypothetical protein
VNANGRVQFENRLWKAQRGLCSICTKPLERGLRFHDFTGWSLDHVFPRSRYKRLGNRGNVLLAHRHCNTVKADREPTGCEILLLHAVNAQLGHQLVEDCEHGWQDIPFVGPTAIELAWQRYVQRQASATTA